MIVLLSTDAEADIVDAFRFYERQNPGLGEYFRDCIIADIESLSFLGGMHERVLGYYRVPAKRFPFAIYYECEDDVITILAVVDARRDPSWIHRRLN